MKHSIKVLIAFAFCLTMILAASFDAYAAKTYVMPLYSTNGSNWNDYVVNDGLDDFTASDIACTGDETGGYSACLHGGEMRMVEIKKADTCLGLTATDSLDAFNWVCDESTSRVRMVSTGLKDGKNLSDLLDFATIKWKPNSVTVYEDGVEVNMTEPVPWWTNPVVIENRGGNLNVAGTIYVVTNTNNTLYYSYVISAPSVGLVVKPGVIIDGSLLSATYVILADGSSVDRNFLWIEGELRRSGNSPGDSHGINLNTIRFSVIRNVKVQNTNNGVVLKYSPNNKLTEVVSTDNNNGVFLHTSSYNTFTGITVSNNRSDGVQLHQSWDNILTNVKVNSNYHLGISMWGSSRNTLSDITVANNSIAIYILSSSSNAFTNVTAVNNANVFHIETSGYNTLADVMLFNNNNGITFSRSHNNKLSGITLANGGRISLLESSNNVLSSITSSNGSPVSLYTSSNNTISGVTASNVTDGLSTFGYYSGDYDYSDNSNNTFSGISTTDNDRQGIFSYEASYHYFTGPLKVGYNSTADCYVYGGTDPGLADVTCENQGASDALLTRNVTVADSFSGKQTTDDAVNTSDINGSALYAEITDWTGFENPYRAWGNDGLTFPDLSNRGPCTTGTCRIWDWSAAIDDTVIKDALAFPTGDDTLVHTWSNQATTTLLKNAVEIRGDEMGNENTLCESGETCLYTPNIGSYQGHGNLVSAGPFTDGTITGVTMMMYEYNGR